MNNIGIAMIIKRDRVIVVQILSECALCVTKLDYGKDRGIQLHGKMLDLNYGIYAVKLTNSVTNETILIIDPMNIEYDSSNKE